MSIYFTIATDNLKKQKEVYLPYFISSILMVILFHQIVALSRAKDLLMHLYAGQLTALLSIAMVVMGFFSIIFLFYTNSYLMKRRQREFALFGILGMEKKQLRKVLFWQIFLIGAGTLITALLLSTLLFHLNQKLVFRLLNIESITTYMPDIISYIITIILFVAIFSASYLHSAAKIYLANPMKQLLESKAGEKPPRLKPISSLLAILFLATGYYLALRTTKIPIQQFPGAVLAVMIGTYLSFFALSAVILKLLQKTKLYYTKKHFLVISGLRFRLRQNAIGLANICILSTAVILLVVSSVSLYMGLDAALDEFISHQFMGYSQHPADTKLTKFFDEHTENITTVDRKAFSYTAVYAQLKDGVIGPVDTETMTSLPDQMIFIYPEKGFEKEDKIIIYDPQDKIKDTTLDMLADKRAEKSPFPTPYNHFNANAIQVIFPDRESYDVYSEKAIKLSGKSFPSNYRYLEYFDTELDSEKQIELYREILDKSGDYYIKSRAQEYREIMTFYSGILIVGIYLSAVFFIAVTLLIYYKQLTEGYEDNKRFTVMRRVGMSEREIKKTINTQILYVFFIPLVFAGIHMCFALPLLQRIFFYNMAMRFNISFYLTFVAIYLIFALIYFIVYKLSSRTYYRLVSKSSQTGLL